ncbi:hypothetical protein COEX109129_41430 [Corallococcus exiguus]
MTVAPIRLLPIMYVCERCVFMSWMDAKDQSGLAATSVPSSFTRRPLLAGGALASNSGDVGGSLTATSSAGSFTPVSRDRRSASMVARPLSAAWVRCATRAGASDAGAGEMEDSTNRFTVRAASRATSRMNNRFTLQKYLRKKSSITLPGESQPQMGP